MNVGEEIAGGQTKFCIYACRLGRVAAFIPVLFGIFFRNVPLIAPVAAAVTAIGVHFGVYYGGLISYTQGTVGNPGASSALAIIAATVVGLSLYFVYKPAYRPKTE